MVFSNLALFASLLSYQTKFANEPLTRVKFAVLDDHAYVSCRINGQGPFLLNIDTGGGMGLSSGLASHLKIRSDRTIIGGGVGAGEQNFGTFRDLELQIGEVTISGHGGTIEPAKVPDSLVAGIGDELFRAYTVAFDYDRHEMSLYSKGVLPELIGYQRLPMEIYNRMPLVELDLDGHKGKFTFDTGAGISMLIQRDFWLARGFRESASLSERKVIGHGIGGEIFGYTGFATSVNLGDCEMKDVRVTFSDMTKGSMAQADRAGTIGQKILKQFNVIYDYAGKAVLLKPNSSFVKKNKITSLGIVIAYLESNLYVARVPAESVAAAIGIKAGDSIVAINGVPIQSVADSALIRAGSWIDILRGGDLVTLQIPK